MWFLKPNIGRLKTKRDVARLIQLLFDANRQVREEALAAVIGLGEAAVPSLIGKLEFDSIRFDLDNHWVSIMLHGHGDRVELLQEECRQRYPVVPALAKIGGPSVQPLLDVLKGCEFVSARILATLTLAMIEDERRIDALLVALESGLYPVRQLAAGALVSVGDARAVEPLIEVLERRGEDYLTKLLSARALGRIKDPRAIDPLIGFLDRQLENRLDAAFQALAEIGEPAVGPLIESLASENQATADKAAAVLAEITGQAFGRDIGKWRRWHQQAWQSNG
ncbi:MAG: HEAT repeat domain-containing protein [Longimicrobiales bacterium]|nr:HEAT repeat domain-containing protein [Longimicrobiales bacterium]